MLPGDFSGIVLAIDPQFEPKKGLSRPDDSPGHKGQMRVLEALEQRADLEELWPLAMHHPNEMYVGPTVPLQGSDWQAQDKSLEHPDQRIATYKDKV
ncbi:hypothetical protein N7507_000050 [Penicillium longicatenatum]|nr:hypothetical protein N7507_000050 [Penicillium longicatenatum]